MFTRLRVPVLLCGLSLLAAGGCVLPASEQPLSDDDTSLIDARLIGRWVPVPKGAAEDSAGQIFLVGRVAGSKSTMEVVFAELESQEVKVKRVPFFVTKIGDRFYGSMQSGDPKKEYLLMNYRFVEGEKPRLQLYMLDNKFVAGAIESGQLAGEVKRKDGKPQGDLVSIRITAQPADLAAFLEKNADSVLSSEPLELRNVEK